MAFGSIAVDARGPIQRWPAVSMLTGLLGNALGLRRTDSAALDRLQERLRWAARIDREGDYLFDFQTAELGSDDQGWTTRGVPEGRKGGVPTYASPHLRYRDYTADASVLVALRLDPDAESPTLADLADAIQRPQRPLFIGRKPCVPAVPLYAGFVEATDAVEALRRAPWSCPLPPAATIFFPAGESAIPVLTQHHTSDRRRFDLDVHVGNEVICEVHLPVAGAPS
jgi:CRISPR system Cascade subunit CasD